MRILSVLTDVVAPAFAILGPLLYAVLRLAYFFFYQGLRTTPEEVGYGYTRILSESVVGTVELLVLIFVVVLAMRFFVRLAGRIMPKIRFRRGARAVSVQERLWTERALLQAVTVAAALLVLIYPLLGWQQGTLARRGQTVRNVYFVGLPYLPVLAVQAVPAYVAWLDPDAERTFMLTGRNCLLYLGNSAASEGTAVFYDVHTRDSIRLPAAQVSITLLYTFSTDPHCVEQ